VGANLPIPADATRINATGKWITPGLIDGAGQLGLVEINAVPGRARRTSRATRSPRRSTSRRGSNPASTLIPVTRIEGITTALAAPTGNLVSGQAVLIDLDGATIEQMLVKSPAGIVVDLSESAKDDAGGSRAAVRIGYGACSATRSSTSDARPISARADAAADGIGAGSGGAAAHAPRAGVTDRLCQSTE